MGNRGMKQMRGLRAIPNGKPRRGQRRWKDDKFQFGHAELEVSMLSLRIQFGHAELEDHWDRDIPGSGAGGAEVGGGESWGH